MLSFRQWLDWVRELPWSVKWFIPILLLRPLIDGFYTLKEISPFLSPLYIVGVLTPILTLIAVVRLPAPKRSSLDPYFKAWAFFIALPLLFLFFQDTSSIRFLQYLFKLTMPLYLFLLFRYLIRRERDLNGVLQTFLYSTLIVVAVFFYELIGGPIRIEESRGLTRIQGFFGDVMNYAIYLTQGFLVVAYFHFKDPSRGDRSFIRVLLSIGIALAILFNIHHAATLGILSCLLLLFIWNERRRKTGLLFLLSIGIVGATIHFGQSFLEEEVSPLITEELEVIQGEEETDKLLHGRVSRWRHMWGKFREEGPLGMAFGYPLSFEYPYQMISTGAHNDYLRILFFSGFFGLIIYLGILRSLLLKLRKLDPSHRFLAVGSLLILLLFSITTTPTLYPPMLYVLYSIFAFMALPREGQSTDAQSPDPDPRKAPSSPRGALSDDRDHPRLLS